MLWKETLDEIKKECDDAAIIGLESGLSFTTSNNGLKLNGKECVHMINQIRNGATTDGTIEVAEIAYTLMKYEEKDSVLHFKSKEMIENEFRYLSIAFTRMLVFVALLSKDKSASLYCLTRVQDSFGNKGM